MCLVCIEWAKFPNLGETQSALDKLYDTREISGEHYAEVFERIEEEGDTCA